MRLVYLSGTCTVGAMALGTVCDLNYLAARVCLKRVHPSWIPKGTRSFVLEWPNQNSNLNIIENLLLDLKKAAHS